MADSAAVHGQHQLVHLSALPLGLEQPRRFGQRPGQSDTHPRIAPEGVHLPEQAHGGFGTPLQGRPHRKRGLGLRQSGARASRQAECPKGYRKLAPFHAQASVMTSTDQACPDTRSNGLMVSVRQRPAVVAA